MAKMMVVYHSVSGNTKALAEAVAEGVWSVSGVMCDLRSVKDISNDDLLAVDGIIVGSPTYFGQMSAEIKAMFDRTVEIYGQLDGKVGAAFTTSGGAGCGHELTNMSIIIAMLVNGMIIQGDSTGAFPHFGPFAVGVPDEKTLKQAYDMGAKIARLVLQVVG